MTETPDSSQIARAASALALLGIAALTAHRWSMLSPYPPGLDGAQWLALGRGFHGVGRASEGAYPPLIPLLATLAEFFLGPLLAVRLLAAGTWLALGLVIWLIAASAFGPAWALLTIALVLPASALAEPVFYGGYPQQLALASGLVAIWAACAWLTRRDRRFLAAVSLAAVVCALAHHIYYPLALLSLAACYLLWSFGSPARKRQHALCGLALALLPSVAIGLVTARILLVAGYTAPLEGSDRSVAAAWQYVAREAPLLWLVLVALAMICLVVTWRKRRDAAWLFAAGTMAPAALLFLVSGQPRLAPPVLVGAAFGITFGGRLLTRCHPNGRVPVVVTAIALSIALLVSSTSVANGYAVYYRVADRSLVAAASAIAADGRAGVVAVRQDRRGWPIGWWFEALQTSPVLVGADPQWLAFPDERERALQAATLFDGRLDGSSLLARTEAAGVRYLVTPKWDWIGWERWIQAADFPATVIFDDDRYLVLRIDDPRTAP